MPRISGANCLTSKDVTWVKHEGNTSRGWGPSFSNPKGSRACVMSGQPRDGSGQPLSAHDCVQWPAEAGRRPDHQAVRRALEGCRSPKSQGWGPRLRCGPADLERDLPGDRSSRGEAPARGVVTARHDLRRSSTSLHRSLSMNPSCPSARTRNGSSTRSGAVGETAPNAARIPRHRDRSRHLLYRQTPRVRRHAIATARTRSL